MSHLTLPAPSGVQLDDAIALRAAAQMPCRSLVCSTDDMRQAQEQISRIYTSYRYTCQGEIESPAQMYNLPGNAISLSRFSYGTDIDIEPEPFKDFLLVLSTLEGHSTITTPLLHVSGGVGTTVLVAPNDESRYHYDSHNTQLVTKIDSAKVTQLAQEALHRETWSFPIPSQHISNPQHFALWKTSITHLRQLLDPATDSRSRELLLPRAEELLILSLLANQSDWLESDARVSKGINPGCLKRAISHIENHADQPVMLVDIANAAHCSVRTLHRAFRDWRDISPMRYLKEVRLRNVRQNLLHPKDGDCVTSIALRWGFMHLGQFSVDYKQVFGEKPSQTFRRAH